MADLLTHLWQSTAVGMVVLLVLAVGRGLAAHTRRILAGMALVKFILPAGLFTPALAWVSAAMGHGLEAGSVAVPLILPAFVVKVPHAEADVAVPWGIVLVGAWTLGAAVLAGSWWLRGRGLSRRLLSTAEPVAPAMEQRIARAAERVGLRAPMRALMVESVQGPGVLGIFSPVLILPRGLGDTLTPAELDSVLIHECVHLQRRDGLWRASQALLGAGFWFHPLVWILSRQLDRETERSCDERVLEITGDPDTYAEGIIKSVRLSLGLAQPGFTGVGTPPVLARIKNILAHETRRDRPMMRRIVLASGVMLLALSGYAGTFGLEPFVASAPATVAANRPVQVSALIAAEASGNAPPAPAAPVQDSIVAVSEAPASKPVVREEVPAIAPQVERLLTPEPAAQTKIAPTPEVVPVPAPALPVALAVVDADKAPVAAPVARASAAPVAVETPALPPAVVEVVTPPAPTVAKKNNGVKIYDINQLDQMPRVKSQTRPQYPFELRRKNIRGEAVVDFVVDPDGKVQAAHAVSFTHKDFAAAAVAAVNQWRFKPGVKNGRPVNTHMLVPIVFTLNNS